MLFVGDIAIPYHDSIQVFNLPNSLKDKNWFGNLEGALIDNVGNARTQPIVFNDKKAVEKLLDEFNFAGLALANNHIFDTGSFQDTTQFFRDNNTPYCGIGRSINEATVPLKLQEDGNQIIVLNFGWEVIQCEIATGDKIGVNPLRRLHVLRTVGEAVKKYSNYQVVVFVHWSYELEAEPQPFERELAKKLIEIGAAGVIGCHPHRIGGFETHQGRPIVYSLGNWMFKQCYYHDGRLRFPKFCNHQLAFEWDFQKNEFKFHFFEYNHDMARIVYIHTEENNSKTMKDYTPFRGFDNKSYKRWYRKNHYHKLKGLPIYYWEDNSLTINLKNRFNEFRDQLIAIYLRTKRK